MRLQAKHGTLTHAFVSAVPDGADLGQIQPLMDWNDEHVFAGAATGALLYYDSVQSDHSNWIAAVAVGLVLVSAGVGVAPAWSASPALNSITLTVPLAATSGGTGKNVYAVGDVLAADTTTTLSRVADVAVGRYFRSGGVSTLPLWSTLVLPNTSVTGDLLASTATSTIGPITAVAAGSYLRSAGLTTLPVWSTLILPNAAAVGDLLAATVTNTVSVIAAVATGSYLRSAGVTTLPVWSTLTLPNAAAVGDLLAATATNVTGVIAAVASGSVLASAGVTTLPVYTAAPSITSITLSSFASVPQATGLRFAGTHLLSVTATDPTAALTLTIPSIRQAETVAIRPQIYTTLSTVKNPVGTGNTSGLMMGLAGAITPQVTGNIRVTICGVISNTTGNGSKVEIRMGTGGAPSNAGALTGAVYGSQQAFTSLTGVLQAPFCLSVIVTGLTVGTAYWIDVDLAAVTGGTALLTSVAIDAFEL